MPVDESVDRPGPTLAEQHQNLSAILIAARDTAISRDRDQGGCQHSTALLAILAEVSNSLARAASVREILARTRPPYEEAPAREAAICAAMTPHGTCHLPIWRRREPADAPWRHAGPVPDQHEAKPRDSDCPECTDPRFPFWMESIPHLRAHLQGHGAPFPEWYPTGQAEGDDRPDLPAYKTFANDDDDDPRGWQG